jgi:hypothetical protein
MKALSVGLPGRLKSSVTPRMKAHRSSSLLIAGVNEELSDKRAALQRLSRNLAVNSEFSVLLHYREDVSSPRQLAETVRQILEDAGFKVALSKSTGARVQDRPNGMPKALTLTGLRNPEEITLP